MELLKVSLRQGLKPGTPRTSGAWGPDFAAILLAAAVALINVLPSYASQQGTAAGTKPNNQTTAAPNKAKPAKKSWRVRVISDAPIPSISIKAKNAPMAEVIAELQRQLGIPVVLTPLVKKQLLTVEFADFPLESALQLLAPHAVIDYVVNGGSRGAPSTRKPLAVYLTAYNEQPPASPPYLENESGAQLLVGMVYGTEDEEKEALEKKKNDLQVSFEDNLFKVKVNKQYLTDVLEEIALKAQIPFAILTTDATQKEVDEVVDLDVKNSSLEDLIMTWFPDAIRLYYRADLQASVSRPLRITLERPSKAQAQAQ